MKPVARLHLIKQREYEKRCPQGARFGNGAVGNPSIGMYNSGGKLNCSSCKEESLVEKYTKL